jgi:hypothetical protein
VSRIYTEIRIEHETLEEKEQFEKLLDDGLKKLFYGSRAGWIRQKAREVIETTK